MQKRIQELLEDRYLLKDEEGWYDIAHRVAKVVSSEEEEVDMWYQEFMSMIDNMDFIPNSPCLMNAGTEEQYMSACNVLPVDDSMDSIFEAIKQLALVNKAGSGTGFAFSRLRRRGAKVGDIDGVSSGPVSFMKIFDKATDIVKQGGRRKGANMGVLKVDHPDILEFIKSKGELDDKNKEIIDKLKDQMYDSQNELIKNTLLENQLTNFNISVGITDRFMDALINDNEYELISPKTGKTIETISAKKVWDEIVKYAHKNGEPGLIFLDTINENHPINEYIEGVNVCGEQPLLPNESCTLGAINLSHIIYKNGTKYFIDWDFLNSIVGNAVRFLDNIIDLNDYPLDELEEMAKKYRKIGIGVMGFHEMLIKLNIPYDSQEARDLAEDLSNYINRTAIQYSEALAEERGAFPGFRNTDIETPRRNAVLTTVAPTGSRALIANTSYGIEPFYSFDYTHTDAKGNETQLKYEFTEDVDDEVLRTALEIEPLDHLLMQAAWQKDVGSAVSKTINLPTQVTKGDIDFIYREAFMRELKGITIYRNNSRGTQVLNDKTKDKKSGVSDETIADLVGDIFEDDEEEEQFFEEQREATMNDFGAENNLERGELREAQEEAKSYRFKLTTGCGTMWLIIVVDNNDNIIETFTESANGGCMIFTRATSRLISIALRGGINLDDIVDQLLSAGSCPAYQAARGSGKDVSPGSSCAGAIALKLKEVRKKLKNGEIYNDVETYESTEDVRYEEKEIKSNEALCPDCGAELDHEGGCMTCSYCGWSKCG